MQLESPVVPTHERSATPQGSLIVVGTGISAGQITREALRHIEIADIVLYCVADIATERLILTLNSNTEDLYFFYADDKPRSQTYVEMTDRILTHVRNGRRVCVAFYGHPGIFVTSSHSAIEQARNEGHEAYMVPAVSSLDCLFADLGIDPASSGCQILEATQFLCRNRQLDKHSSVILLQVGCVGDWGWSSRGYDGRNVPLLSDRLQEVYGADYEVAIYQASSMSILPPLIRVVKLKHLGSASVSGISTLYIPAVAHAPLNLDILRIFENQQPHLAALSAQSTA
jgi:precorrin-2 methylase